MKAYFVKYMSIAYLRSARNSLIVLFSLYRSSDLEETSSAKEDADKGVEMDTHSNVGHCVEEYRVNGKVWCMCLAGQ